MSWGITCTTGDPAAVKKALVSQFKNATACVASNPHEVATVEAAAVIVNSQLDFMIESGFPAVTVKAGGSCYDYSAVDIRVEPLWGFLVKPAAEPEPIKIAESEPETLNQAAPAAAEAVSAN